MTDGLDVLHFSSEGHVMFEVRCALSLSAILFSFDPTVAAEEKKPEDTKTIAYWIAKLDDGRVGRIEAAEALGAFGPEAAAAIPKLIRMLETGDTYEGSAAERLLVRIGSQSVLPLIDALKNPKCANRASAAQALGSLGAAAKVAVHALVEALKSENDSVVLSAVAALGNIDPDAEIAVPALLNVARNQSMHLLTRGIACSSLERIGPKAASALPALTKLLTDKATHPHVQRQIVSALSTIDPTNPNTVRLLREALKHQYEFVRVEAAHSLARVGKGAEVVDFLAAHALDPKSDSRIEALIALGDVGPNTTASAALRKIVGGSYPEELRSRAIEPLMNVDPAGAGPSLLIAVADAERSGWLQMFAARALRHPAVVIGAEAVPPLLVGLRHEVPAVRTEAAITLGSIGPRAKDAVAALTAALKDKEEAVRKAASEALGRINSK